MHCGLCVEVCPKKCIEGKDRHLAMDGSLKFEGKSIIDLDRCIHCGWCAAVCPTGAISFEKPFAGLLFSFTESNADTMKQIFGKVKELKR